MACVPRTGAQDCATWRTFGELAKPHKLANVSQAGSLVHTSWRKLRQVAHLCVRKLANASRTGPLLCNSWRACRKLAHLCAKVGECFANRLACVHKLGSASQTGATACENGRRLRKLAHGRERSAKEKRQRTLNPAMRDLKLMAHGWPKRGRRAAQPTSGSLPRAFPNLPGAFPGASNNLPEPPRSLRTQGGRSRATPPAQTPGQVAGASRTPRGLPGTFPETAKPSKTLPQPSWSLLQPPRSLSQACRSLPETGDARGLLCFCRAAFRAVQGLGDPSCQEPVSKSLSDSREFGVTQI